jgi:hypothetical protein
VIALTWVAALAWLSAGPHFLMQVPVNEPVPVPVNVPAPVQVSCPAGAARGQALWVTLEDPRLTPLKYLIQPAQLPSRFCLTTQTESEYQRKWRVDFEIDGLLLTFQTAEAPKGGNARGQTWQLQMPLKAKHHLLLAQYPFLACKRWTSHRYCAWHFFSSENAGEYTVSGSNLAQPCQSFHSWEAIFRELAQGFRACPDG